MRGAHDSRSRVLRTEEAGHNRSSAADLGAQLLNYQTVTQTMILLSSLNADCRQSWWQKLVHRWLLPYPAR